MKRVIRGRLYDTDTATVIGAHENSDRVYDLNWMRETLYRKRTGEFFIFGEGGANTKYAEQPRPDALISGESIVPITYDEAKEFAEKYLTADEYASAFEVAKEDGYECIRAYIPAHAKRLLKLESQRTGETITQIITRLAETLKID